MKKLWLVLFAGITILSAGAQSMPNETKVRLIVGSDTYNAVLNDTTSAVDLISKLPYTVRVNRSAVDYCGRLDKPLETRTGEAQAGWKNGDISYIPGADWIAFFFGGEEGSASYGNNQHIIGRVENLESLKAWPQGSVEVRIELFE